MKVLSSVPALLLAVALPAAVLAPVSAAPSTPGGADAGVREAAHATHAAHSPGMPTLVRVSAAHRNGRDQVVFRFRGPLPQTRVEYVDRLYADGSGKRLRVAGRAILQVRFEPARAHTALGAPTAAPRRRAFALPNVMTAVRAGDFEGQVTYGLGLARRTRVSVRTRRNPSRVVVRLRADFPTIAREVFFLDRDNFASGDEPWFVPVIRQVSATEPATAVLDRLFAGPTPAEMRRGLRLVRSGATGHTDLEITGGIARVRLLGGCSSGGSTATVAGSIQPTLRQFDSVDWVKIYDRAGQTGQPGGTSDSIPACLEP